LISTGTFDVCGVKYKRVSLLRFGYTPMFSSRMPVVTALLSSASRTGP
jgi:hypothetical protein